MVNVEVARVATPALRAFVPSAVEPSMNVTFPAGVPLLDFTVAVSVTDWPATDGLAEEVSVVVVDASTTWVTGLDVLAAKSELEVSV